MWYCCPKWVWSPLLNISLQISPLHHLIDFIPEPFSQHLFQLYSLFWLRAQRIQSFLLYVSHSQYCFNSTDISYFLQSRIRSLEILCGNGRIDQKHIRLINRSRRPMRLFCGTFRKNSESKRTLSWGHLISLFTKTSLSSMLTLSSLQPPKTFLQLPKNI